MALKPDRQVIEYEIGYFMDQVATRGGVVVTSGTAGSGAAMDHTNQKVEYAANPSGKTPVGILLNDFVNVDQSRQTLNQYKSERQVGDKAVLARQGTFVTDNLLGTITAPAPAYLGPNGALGSANGYAGSGYPRVGTFMTTVDPDGYAKVRISIENSG